MHCPQALIKFYDLACPFPCPLCFYPASEYLLVTTNYIKFVTNFKTFVKTMLEILISLMKNFN